MMSEVRKVTVRQRSEEYRQQLKMGRAWRTSRMGPGDKRQTATVLLQGRLGCWSQILPWPTLCLRKQSPAVRGSQEWLHIWTSKPGELCMDYLALAQEFLCAHSRGAQRRKLTSHLVFNLERIAFLAVRKAIWPALSPGCTSEQALTASRETKATLVC